MRTVVAFLMTIFLVLTVTAAVLLVIRVAT